MRWLPASSWSKQPWWPPLIHDPPTRIDTTEPCSSLLSSVPHPRVKTTLRRRREALLPLQKARVATYIGCRGRIRIQFTSGRLHGYTHREMQRFIRDPVYYFRACSLLHLSKGESLIDVDIYTYKHMKRSITPHLDTGPTRKGYFFWTSLIAAFFIHFFSSLNYSDPLFKISVLFSVLSPCLSWRGKAQGRKTNRT